MLCYFLLLLLLTENRKEKRRKEKRESTRACLYSFSALADPIHVGVYHVCLLFVCLFYFYTPA